MSFERFVIGCIYLSIWPYVVRCQSDASLQMGESSLSQPDTGFEPGRFVDDGIDDVKLTVDNQNMVATDYQKFGIDGHRLARDVDSVESSVNVNVNGLVSSRFPWNKRRSKQPNRRPELTPFGRNGKSRINKIMRLIHQMPNSNFDYNFAHPDGYVRLQRGGNSRGKTLQNPPNDDNGEFMPSGSTSNQCEPIVHKVVRYLRLMENDLINLENDLWSFVSDPNYNFP